jgi:SAM-dependent methyltransferase
MPEPLAEIFERIGAQHQSTKPQAFYARYDQYFAELADRPITLLELGVLAGDSAKTFASFFVNGKVIGVDIEDRGIDFSLYPNIVFAQGDQRNAEQLDGICAAHAPHGLDIVIDDASHFGWWSAQSYAILYPHLKLGGLYVVEDWATGYWDNWPDGGRFSASSRKPPMIRSPNVCQATTSAWWASSNPWLTKLSQCGRRPKSRLRASAGWNSSTCTRNSSSARSLQFEP